MYDDAREKIKAEKEAKKKKLIKYTMIAVIALVGVVLFFSSFYRVQQTEVANIRRFGVAVYEQPKGPGLHFKFPFIDKVDTIQTSLDTIHVDGVPVTTVDNQVVTISVNLNFTVEPKDANFVMYSIGRAGSVDIDKQLIPVVRDRIGIIFATRNMNDVNSKRSEIQEALKVLIYKDVADLFHITPHSLQIDSIKPSPQFIASNEAAVKAKNEAIAAENAKKTRQYEADQNVIAANGLADAKIAEAKGAAESVTIAAEAEKQKLILEAQGREAEIRPFGSAERYIEYLKAKAALNWNGVSPQVVSSGNAGGATIVVPIGSPTK